MQPDQEQRFRCAATRLSCRQPRQFSRVGNEICCSLVAGEACPLRHVSDAAPHVERVGRDLDVEHSGGTSSRVNEPQQDSDERCFACTVGPDQACDARRDVEVDTGEGIDGTDTGVVALCEIRRVNDGHSGEPSLAATVACAHARRGVGRRRDAAGAGV